jgi:hypothetical protein
VAIKSKYSFWLGEPATIAIITGVVAFYVGIHIWKKNIAIAEKDAADEALLSSVVIEETATQKARRAVDAAIPSIV